MCLSSHPSSSDVRMLNQAGRPAEQHSRIGHESPASMAVNVAQELLGPLYALYVAALGEAGGWALGHLTLLGIIALVAWVLKNRHEVITNLDLRPRSIGGMLMLIVSFVAFTLVCTRSFGYPLGGAVLTSMSGVLFVLWTYRWLEGARA